MARPRTIYDIAIIGGGIVGLATARRLSVQYPKLKVCLLEKETELATHQSGRNSGVVHCGIYYKKKSLKSRFCIRGAELIKQYCQDRGLPYKQCGKLIVATDQDELETLHELHSNALANEIKGIEMFNPTQIQGVQPGCTRAIEALWSPNTAIVDWQEVALSYAKDFQQNGGTIHKNFLVVGLKDNVKSLCVENAMGRRHVLARTVVNCAGIYADMFARITGNSEHPKNVPFKGKYYLLSDRLAPSIKTNIYPVPNPKVPFLGVHITPRIDGSVIVGPTSLLITQYERYTDKESFSFTQWYHIVVRSGVLKMLRKPDYFSAGLDEIWRLASRNKLTRDVKKFLPELKPSDLIDTEFCGIRAQAINKDGSLVDDFLFESGLRPEFNRVLHVRNCPSPAATSSLAIAERVVKTLEDRLL